MDATRKLYETLLQRLKEASIAAALRANNIRIVDAASVPEDRTSPTFDEPSRWGCCSARCSGSPSPSFASGPTGRFRIREISAYHLGLPELGVVPVGRLLDVGRSRKAPLSLPSGAASLTSRAPDDRVELISFREKTSLLAESFRATLTSILFSQHAGDRPRVLVMTSASPKEGKTTVVSNLAITVAEIQRQVLVIDADMRRPRLHQVFDVENKRGLSNLLTEAGPLEAAHVIGACVECKVPRLFVLPSGNSRTHASSLLYSRGCPSSSHSRGSTSTRSSSTPRRW